MKCKYLSLFSFLLFYSLIFGNAVSANNDKETIDANEYVSQNLEFLAIELSNEIKTFEFEKNKIIEMDKVFFNNLLSINSDRNFAPENSIAVSAPLLGFKTITMTYDTPNFPKSVQYSEYNYGTWYKGKLAFQSSVYKKGKYVATFYGWIVRQSQ